MPVSAQNVLIQPASGRAVSFFGNRAIFKVRGDQTSGAFSITEVVLAPSGTLVPPNRHEKMAEVSYILEGTLGVMVAEQEFQAGPGSFVIRPKGVPHALWNMSDRPVRTLEISMPGGFDAWAEELARLASATPPASLEQLFDAARRYDAIFLPELAPPLINKYKLRMPGEAAPSTEGPG